MAILSIQSHVAYGRVGNRAAVFPMELLGHEVWPINTVQFSNHTGYGTWRGTALDGNAVTDLVSGVGELGVFSRCRAVLSGYLGDPSVGTAVAGAVVAVKRANTDAVYCCDPVMGDEGGFYVPETVRAFMRNVALPLADIVTPNRFEAEHLSGVAVRSPADARRACNALHDLGPRIAIVTSLRDAERPDSLSTFLSHAGTCWVVTTPEVRAPQQISGSGDLFAALFLARWLACGDARKALELAVASVFAVVERTVRNGARELDLVGARGDMLRPTRVFRARRVP